MIKEIVAAAGAPSDDVKSRMAEIVRLLDAGPAKAKPKKAEVQQK
jgi:hypothetical protein